MSISPDNPESAAVIKAGDGPVLTYAQAPIFVGQQLHPTSPLYNMAFAFVVPDTLNQAHFKRAWQLVADASDALRTRVPGRDGASAALELAASAPALSVIELAAGGASLEAFESWCRLRSQRVFDLAEAAVESVLVPLSKGRTGWFLNQHHLVTDAASTALLVERVSQCYEALARAQALGEPGGPGYYETASLLHQDGARDQRAAEFWSEASARPRRVVALYGRHGPAGGTESRRLTIRLDAARSDSFRALCTADGFQGLTPEIARFNGFATLLCALLSRLEAQEEVLFDAPVAGRPDDRARHSVGCLVELFPFRMRVEQGDSFRSLARRCLAHSYRWLGAARPGHSAAIKGAANVVLNYLPLRFPSIAGHMPEVTWVHSGHADAFHALRLQVHDFTDSGRITLHFDCNESALPAADRERLLAHFEAMLHAMLQDPDQPIAAVELLQPQERALLQTLQGDPSPPLPAVSLIERLADRCAAHPDQLALREGAATTSYKALWQQLEALAGQLQARGVGAGDRVLVTGDRSRAMVVALLAVLRCGAAYIPVDGSAPPDRIAQIVTDAKPRLVLTAGGREVPALPVPVLDLELPLKPTEAFAGPMPSTEDIAYLIYTSGSTGTPKGVVVDHLGLADYLAWAERNYLPGEPVHAALFTSLAFDLTVTSLYLPLLTGGVVDIYPESRGSVDGALIDVLTDNRVNFLKLTPSHLTLLVRQPLQNSKIRYLVLGGENLPARLATAALERLGEQVVLVNEYGPTEAVVGCVAHRFDPRQDLADNVPIGRPIDHVTIDIVNEAGVTVPPGVAGELQVSRPGLARGYHGLEALTAQKFQPQAQAPGARRYATGDLVRLGDRGLLEYLGRIDRQLKLSGYRIEPGEIEHLMREQPGIADCLVLANRPARARPEAEESGAPDRCDRCGLASNVPGTRIDEAGICSVCRTFETVREHAADYFKTEADLRAVFEASGAGNRSNYDCLMLYSGGKDSTYALSRLVEMGYRVYAFTLDNGYISEGAKDNIRQVTTALGVPVEFATTPAMKAIFRDSLTRFSNVCNGCFKTIYSLSMQRAYELGIPLIVTGLSRGQMFETRLTEDMFRGGACSPASIDAAVLAARKAYHRVPDEVTRSLDSRLFEDDAVFEAVRFVDFYRYVDVGLDEVYRYLREQLDWTRPADTGRSTNCLINDVGIWVHQAEQGFHNYALPYSWDVRMGHKTREAALEELDDKIDRARVDRILDEIGYQPSLGDQPVLEAFYVAESESAVPDEDALRASLAARLPRALVPSRFLRVDAIPLAASGKVDEKALAALAHEQHRKHRTRPYRPPEGPVEAFLVALWEKELGLDRVSADDHFFELGGSSLLGMQVMLTLCREYDIDLPLETLFTEPVLAALARKAEDQILADIEGA